MGYGFRDRTGSRHYACAPKEVSADYFGIFREHIRKLSGGDASFVAIMTQGASGDLQWMDYSKPRKQIDVRLFAEELAAAALASTKPIRYRHDIPIDARHTTLQLMRRYPDRQRLQWAAEVWRGIPVNRRGINRKCMGASRRTWRQSPRVR